MRFLNKSRSNLKREDISGKGSYGVTDMEIFVF